VGKKKGEDKKRGKAKCAACGTFAEIAYWGRTGPVCVVCCEIGRKPTEK